LVLPPEINLFGGLAMKKSLLLSILVLAGIAILLQSAEAQKKAADNALSEQMKSKLDQSQQVLRGLAMEDYDLIERNARKLRALVDSNVLLPAPEFNEHASSFKRHVNGLIKAAEDKNIEGAALAYMGITLNCVECHKALRGRKVAGLTVPLRDVPVTLAPRASQP
jgi:hypothetical protein